jgi:hypothetical protein
MEVSYYASSLCFRLRMLLLRVPGAQVPGKVGSYRPQPPNLARYGAGRSSAILCSNACICHLLGYTCMHSLALGKNRRYPGQPWVDSVEGMYYITYYSVIHTEALLNNNEAKLISIMSMLSLAPCPAWWGGQAKVSQFLKFCASSVCAYKCLVNVIID